MSTEKFVNTLEDVIRSGELDKLITDSARVEISNRLSTSYDHYASMHGRANLTTNTRISPNTDGSLQAQRRLVHELGIPGYMATTFEWIADVMNHHESPLTGDLRYKS
jgi:hypothetical protein